MTRTQPTSSVGERDSKSLGATHRSLRDEVADEIRERIVLRVLEPGTRIYEEAIADDLGVSRNPIREALQILAAEGFVVIEPRRGASVGTIDKQRADEIFEVRSALEGLVASRAAQRADAVAVAGLRAIIAAAWRAIDAERRDDLVRLNSEFHTELSTIAANMTLGAMLGQLSEIARWIYAERLDERFENSWSEHAQIVAAIEASDPTAAAAAATAHVAAAHQAFINDPQ